MKKRFLLSIVIPIVLFPAWVAANDLRRQTAGAEETEHSTPLVRAHAHNDYLHNRPLLDALDHGFCSVEADVFLVDGELLVGHERTDLTPDRTLTSLYLDPLLVRVRENGGHVYRSGGGFTLLIDIKTEGAATYAALDKVLATYEEMLTTIKWGEFKEGAVTAIISGERSWERIAADPTRYAGVDGRLADLSSDRPNHLMPLISDRWGRFFDWTGQGPMPDAERTKLQQIVDDAHEKGRKIRFWGTPDGPGPERVVFWSELISVGVDLIGTDDLEGLRSFLLSAP